MPSSFCSSFQFQYNAKVGPKKNVDKLNAYICLLKTFVKLYVFLLFDLLSISHQGN